jgi:hypothetical protein
MPRKTTKKTTKVEKAEIPKGIPPKPREKLTPGQELYCWYPPNNTYHKRIYIKDGKDPDWVVTQDELGQKWLVNIEHLHNTILTKEEYEKLGQVDK